MDFIDNDGTNVAAKVMVTDQEAQACKVAFRETKELLRCCDDNLDRPACLLLQIVNTVLQFKR